MRKTKQTSPVAKMALASLLLLCLNIFVGIFTIVNTSSCSKARVQSQTVNSYSSINNYFASKQQSEQTFPIPGPGGGPIIGNQGTKIWVGIQCLSLPNGDSVSYPFTIKLVELYTAKDMIYYQLPTVASGVILNTAGEVRIRAFEGNTQLSLRSTPCMFQVQMPCTNPIAGMSAFYGFTNNNLPDWKAANPVVPFTVSPGAYTASITSLGWINCGQLAPGASNVSVNFTSTTDDLTNVGLFVYLPNTKTLIQVYNTLTSIIPAGSNAKIIAIGVNSSGNLYYWYQQATLNSNSTYSISLSPTTDSALTALLNSL